MLTMDNTEGYTQKELDYLNDWAKDVRNYQNPCDLTEDGLKWAEQAVLKMYDKKR